MSQGCSSEGESCDNSLTCDIDCDGVVDDMCEVRVVVEAAAGGALRIEDGPLAGFSLEIPPGALTEDTEISLLVGPGESLQTAPWDTTDDALLFADAWRSYEEIIEDWDQLQSWGPAFLMEWLSHEGLGRVGAYFRSATLGLAVFKSGAANAAIHSHDRRRQRALARFADPAVLRFGGNRSHSA